MTSKIIVITTSILLLTGSMILFAVEKKQNNYDYKKDWVVVFFNEPAGNVADFTIENHQGEKVEYEYIVSLGEKKVLSDMIEIAAGERKSVELSEENIFNNGKIQNDSFSVEVKSSELSYKIYKNISR